MMYAQTAHNRPVTLRRLMAARGSVRLGRSVTAIGNSAFSNNQLTGVAIPNSVTAIGDWAFWENYLTSVTIPANVDIEKYSLSETFAHVYTQGGRRAGTYTSGDDGKTWTRQ
jgi:hypothetical protein